MGKEKKILNVRNVQWYTIIYDDETREDLSFHGELGDACTFFMSSAWAAITSERFGYPVKVGGVFPIAD